jgi:hypothetical protein
MHGMAWRTKGRAHPMVVPPTTPPPQGTWCSGLMLTILRPDRCIYILGGVRSFLYISDLLNSALTSTFKGPPLDQKLSYLLLNLPNLEWNSFLILLNWELNSNCLSTLDTHYLWNILSYFYPDTPRSLLLEIYNQSVLVFLTLYCTLFAFCHLWCEECF